MAKLIRAFSMIFEDTVKTKCPALAGHSISLLNDCRWTPQFFILCEHFENDVKSDEILIVIDIKCRMRCAQFAVLCTGIIWQNISDSES